MVRFAETEVRTAMFRASYALDALGIRTSMIGNPANEPSDGSFGGFFPLLAFELGLAFPFLADQPFDTQDVVVRLGTTARACLLEQLRSAYGIRLSKRQARLLP